MKYKLIMFSAVAIYRSNVFLSLCLSIYFIHVEKNSKFKGYIKSVYIKKTK